MTWTCVSVTSGKASTGRERNAATPPATNKATSKMRKKRLIQREFDNTFDHGLLPSALLSSNTPLVTTRSFGRRPVFHDGIAFDFTAALHFTPAESARRLFDQERKNVRLP